METQNQAVIKLYPEFFAKALNRDKISTIRKGIKNYLLGEAILLNTETKDTCDIYVTMLCYKKYSDLNENDAKNDGFESLQELQDVIEEIYPDIEDDDSMTVVYFELHS